MKREKDGRFKIYDVDPSNPHSINDRWIFDIHEQIDDKNILWLGTNKGGLNRFDKKRESFRNYVYDPKNKNSLSNDEVTCIHQSKANKLWLGTGSGLNIFDIERESFNVITVKDGLPSNTVLSILEDNNGKLWLGTSNGLSNFDPASMTMVNYTVEDGLQGNDFNERAYFKAKDGKLYFGGSNGISSFYPDSIKENPFAPEVVLTDLYIYDQVVKPREKVNEQVVLMKSIQKAGNIELIHANNNFSIEFAGLHYSKPQKNKYAYMLIGYDDNWRYTDANNRRASYSNLEKGSYEFTVKAANGDGLWSKASANLEVNILPAWWQTWWFMLLAVVSTISIILGVGYLRFRQLKAHTTILEKEVHVRTAELMEANKQLKEMNSEILGQKNMLENQTKQLEEMVRYKTRFFINVSHEFRTPLTLIIAPIEKLLSIAKPSNWKDVIQLIQLIHRNAKRLLQLINQILEIRKTELNKMQMVVVKEDIVAFTRNITELFVHHAKSKKIKLEYSCDYPKIEMWFDPDKFEKIVNNLISNALKHTEENDEILVKVSLVKNEEESLPKKLLLMIKDTGKGILPEHLPHVFEMFYNSSQNEQKYVDSTGIGLALTKQMVNLHGGEISVSSKKGQGSCFTLEIPLEKEMFKASEIIVQEKNKTNAFDNSPNKLVDASNVQEQMKGQFSSNAVNPMSAVLLIVEDNDDMRTFLKTELSSSFNIIDASNGVMGLNKAIDIVPDIIISDVMMPEMDGIEMCKRLKTDERTSHIPIVLLTAKITEDSQLSGLETGADDYISKPFSTNILKARIKNLLESRIKLRELYSKSNFKEIKKVALNHADKKFIERAVDLVEQNLTDLEFSNDQFIREMGMSKTQMYRKLKGMTNKSVSEFIMSIRLRCASEILLTEDLTISETAYMVGYKNPPHFTRDFKIEFGKTPTEFIKEHMGEQEKTTN